MKPTSLLRGAVAVLAAAGVASAQNPDSTRGVRIGLRYDPGSKPGLLVLPVSGTAGDSIRAILERDFDNSDQVSVVQMSSEDGSILAAGNSARGSGPTLNYPLFAKLGIAGVVQVTMTTRGVHLALHDVGRSTVSTVRDFALPLATTSRDWRLALHGVSDAVIEWATGQKGASQTRIAFARRGVVYIIDSDGHEESSVPVVGQAFSPAWSPQGVQLAYNTIGEGSRIVVHDLRTGRNREFGAQRNTSNLSPVFTPDGKGIVFSMSTETSADLYLMPLEGEGFPRRITAGRGSANVSPTFNPDGHRLAFTSDRLGHPEVYIMDADGTNTDAFTAFDFGDQSDRCCADWSPDGRQIAFQSLIDGRYQIFTMTLRDRQPRQLTSEGKNEDPSWAPDGRHLVFASTRSGERQLWILDVESGRLRQLTRVGGAQLPAWSPRLTGR